MKSSRPSTLKGQANQIIKQIVKVVLPSDVVQLQPGRRKKPKKGGKSVKKPRVGRASYAPRGKAPVDGRLPRAPDGLLSHNVRNDKPPAEAYPSVFGDNQARPFAQQTFQPPPSQSFYDRQKQEETDKLLARALQSIERAEKKETPTGTQAVSAPSPIVPVSQPSMSLKQAMQAPPAIIIPQGSPVASRIPPPGSVVQRVIASRSRSMSYPLNPPPGYSLKLEEARARSRSGQILAEEIPSPPPLSGAPNKANQPSVDVDGEGKEAIELQPQAPSITLAQASRPKPMQVEDDIPVPSQASSSRAGLDISKLNLRRKVLEDSDEDNPVDNPVDDLREEIKRREGMQFSARDAKSVQKKKENDATIQRLKNQLRELTRYG